MDGVYKLINGNNSILDFVKLSAKAELIKKPKMNQNLTGSVAGHILCEQLWFSFFRFCNYEKFTLEWFFITPNVKRKQKTRKIIFKMRCAQLGVN